MNKFEESYKREKFNTVSRSRLAVDHLNSHSHLFIVLTFKIELSISGVGALFAKALGVTQK